MSVMHEQLRQLIGSAGRPGVLLQILALNVPGMVCGKLSNISRFGPNGNAELQDMMSTGRPGKDFSRGDGKEIYLHLIACRMLAMTSPGSNWCQELTPKTTESHSSGGQREP